MKLAIGENDMDDDDIVHYLALRARSEASSTQLDQYRTTNIHRRFRQRS